MAERKAYRVTWQRVGCAPKSKVYRSRVLAERRLRLLGPEPWTADPRIEQGTKTPDDFHCCAGTTGDQCACDGETIREAYMAPRKDQDAPPAVEWVRLEERTVFESPWTVLAVPRG